MSKFTIQNLLSVESLRKITKKLTWRPACLRRDMSVLHEARVICTLAWPSCIANMTFLSSMAVMAFVGQYGTDALAGAGLGFISRAAAP